MRYAVISDLHSNRQALRAVLADIEQNKIDEIICLGDIVGYGPSPEEVLDLAREKVNHFILGNHDAVVAGYMSPENFNDNARQLIEWTGSVLDTSARDFFKTIPLLIHGSYYSLSHGEFENPGRFGYIVDEQEAIASFNCCDDVLMLTGHSHVPGLYVIGQSGTPHWLTPQDFGVEEEKRYIVNVGSVGQPRDHDVRASYCILDDMTRDIYFRKVSFDISAYRDDLNKNSLPAISYFLTLEPSAEFSASAVAALDVPTDFAPLSKEDTVKIATEVKDLKKTVDELKKAKSRLLLLIFMLVAAFTAFGVLLVAGVFKPDPVKQTFIYDSLLTEIPPSLKSIPVNKELLEMPEEVKKASVESPFERWSVTVSNPDKQEVATIENIDSSGKKSINFLMKSEEAAPILISSLNIPAKKEMRFNAVAQFKKLKMESGFVFLVLQQQLEDGTWKDILTREPKNLAEKDSWVATSLTQGKKSPISEDGNIRLAIKARLIGEIQIRKCTITRK